MPLRALSRAPGGRDCATARDEAVRSARLSLSRDPGPVERDGRAAARRGRRRSGRRAACAASRRRRSRRCWSMPRRRRHDGRGRGATAAALDVPRATMERLERFAALLREENERQNLVSRQPRWIDLGSAISPTAAAAPLPHEAARLGSIWAPAPAFPGSSSRCRPAPSIVWSNRGGAGRVSSQPQHRLLGVAARVEIVGSRLEAMPTAPVRRHHRAGLCAACQLLNLSARFSTAGHASGCLPKGRARNRTGSAAIVVAG